MPNKFFNPESGIWRVFGYIGDLVLLSLVWGICCIPLLTIGASTTALYDGVVHGLRRRDSEPLARFFATFKKESKNGALSTLLWIGIGAIFFLGYLALRSGGGMVGPVYNTALTLYTLLVPFFLLCVLCWVFPLLSRFTFSTGALNATALRLAFGHILRSVLLSLITIAGFLACYFFVSPLIFVPGCVAYLWSLLMEPVFQKYE